MQFKSFDEIKANLKNENTETNSEIVYENNFEACTINPGEAKVIRFISEHPSFKDVNDNFSFENVRKLVVSKSDGKPYTINLSKDENHPFNRMIAELRGKKSWDANLKKSVFEFENTETYKIWFETNKAKNKYPWKTSIVWFANVIDRSDDWCETHKHTKLFAWKSKSYVNDNGQEKTINTYGLPDSAFKILEKSLNMAEISISDSDVILYHSTDADRNSDASRKFESCILLRPDEKIAINALSKNVDIKGINKLNDASYSNLNIDDYEMYDLKNIPYQTDVTTCYSIIHNFGWFIKLFDSERHTHYMNELVELSKIESEQYKSTHSNENVANDECVDVANEKIETVDEKVENAVRRRSTNTIDWNNISTLYKGVSCMNEENKSHIKSMSSDGKLIFDCDENECGECECGYIFPLSMTICPKCGTNYE